MAKLEAGNGSKNLLIAIQLSEKIKIIAPHFVQLSPLNARAPAPMLEMAAIYSNTGTVISPVLGRRISIITNANADMAAIGFQALKSRSLFSQKRQAYVN